MLACNSVERRCTDQGFQVVETAFTNKEWYDNFRLSKTTFEYIVSRIEDEIGRQDTSGLSVKFWFSTANRLHLAFYRTWSPFLERPGNLSPIYTAENLTRGSDKSGTLTQNNSTDWSFTRPFFYRAKRCKIMVWYG